MNLQRTILKFAFSKAKSIHLVFAASVEAFLHHSFGERYTKVMAEALALATLLGLCVSVTKSNMPMPLFPIYIAALFLRLITHVASAERRRGVGPHIHSYSSGSSWSFWSHLSVSAGVIQCVLEPLLCLVVGIMLTRIDPVLSIWLRVSALALFVKTIMRRFQAREQMLDALDGRASAQSLNAALQQRLNPRSATSDARVATTMPATREPARSLADIFRNLDPALRRFMQEDPQPTTPRVAPQGVRPSDSSAAASPSQRRPTKWATQTTPSSRPRVTVRPAWRSNPAPRPERSPEDAPRVQARPAPSTDSASRNSQRQRVAPTPPGWFGVPKVEATMVAPTAPSTSESTIPRSWPAPSLLPKISEAAPVPNPAEAPKPPCSDKPVATTSTDKPQPETNTVDEPAERSEPDQGANEHDWLREHIKAEAEKLGFVIEVGGQSGTAPSSTADLTITKHSMSLAVEITGATTDHEFANVKRCLHSGCARVALVSPAPEQLKAIAETVHAGLGLHDAMKVSYFTPAEFIVELRRLEQTCGKSRRASATKRAKTKRDTPPDLFGG